MHAQGTAGYLGQVDRIWHCGYQPFAVAYQQTLLLKLAQTDKDPTIADLLKGQGYVTGQFGKNHLGDRDDMIPTNHGFDEFFGNLYHLNAEEEPENPDYPKNEAFKKRFGPRGVIHSFADGKMEDTGPLNKKRMETIDEETTNATLSFMDKAVKEDKPFFIWYNSTRMHIFTHLKPASDGKTGLGVYADGMVEHDDMVGQLLAKLKALGVEDNTIVIYTTDNGAETFTWPDGGTTMFRGEKNTNWEGAYRVPALVRFPGRIEAGTVCKGIGSHLDWFPTLASFAGASDLKESLKQGMDLDGHSYKAHLDGYDLSAYLTGEADESPRPGFIYFNDDGDVVALRYDNWKLVFLEQRLRGTMGVWAEPFVELRVPKMFNLRTDPYERADITSNTYWDFVLNHSFLCVPAQGIVGDFLQTLVDFPPAQKAASFSIDQVMEKIQNAMTAQR